MADSQTNININIDTSQALANLQALQSQISAFQTSMARGTATQAANAAKLRQNLINDINATKKFAASITDIKTTTESFTESLEKNKFSMGQYFKFAGGATKNFGKLFKTEMATIDKVARERVKDLQTQYIQLGRDANGAMKSIAIRPLVLDMDNLGTKTAIAAQKQQLLNQLLKQGATNMLNWGKNTQWAGRQLMVGFTVPLTMAGTAAAKAYMEMEKAAIKFTRVYGDFGTTSKEVDSMVESVKQLASEFTKYGVAVSDTMSMAAEAAAAGKQGVDLLQQVTNATRLAILGNVEQQQALETTMSLTNAFGVAAEDLTGKINFLNAVENQTVTAIEDLTIAIPKAAPVIQQLGGDVEDLAFFLTAMKEGGINASEGANALKSGLASLINPTAKASDFLKGFGINVKGIVEANKGDVKGLVVDFASALDTLDPLNRARAIEQMFGKFQFARLSTLFQNVIAEGSQASKVLQLTQATTEELAILSEREMKKVSDSPMFKFQKSIEDIKAKLVPIGEAFLKAITPVIEFVGKFLDGFNKMSEGAKSFWITTTAIVAGLGPALLMTIGLVGNGVANLIKMFASIKSFLNRTSQNTTALGESTSYMTDAQLRAAAVAASLEQVHQNLEQRFTSEAGAVQRLTDAYTRNISAQSAYSNANVIPTAPVKGGKKFAGGGFVSGPGNGKSDSIPAMLSNGEAVIPAKSVSENPELVKGLISGRLFKLAYGGIMGRGQKQFLGMPQSFKSRQHEKQNAQEIFEKFKTSANANMPVTRYKHQLATSGGHSFPLFKVGGMYETFDGRKVFVKPMMDLQSAQAEMRGTAIARGAHGLQAPNQRLVVMQDPTDKTGTRKFYALESDFDPKFTDIPEKFSKDEYIKQLVASLLRGDKDLGKGNLGSNILADVGTAGVFERASGFRQYSANMRSMEDQALINLLGVKGGAKKWFAETTKGVASSMSPAEYQSRILAEIEQTLPKLKSTIGGFGDLTAEEQVVYQNMIARLEAGKNVDWRKYHDLHSNLKVTPPKKFADGGIVKGPGTGTSDSIVSRLSKGEAVIPAKSVARNPDLVKALISGNVPGFSQGFFDEEALVSQALAKYRGKKPAAFEAEIRKEIKDILTNAVGEVQDTALEQLQKFVDTTDTATEEKMKKFMRRNADTGKNLRQDYNPSSKRQGNVEWAHVRDSLPSNPQNVLDAINANPDNRVAETEKERLALLAKHIPNASIRVASGLAFDQKSSLNSGTKNGGSVSLDEVIQDFKERGPAKWKKSVKLAGLKMDDIAEELKIYDDAVVEGIEEYKKITGATTITSDQFGKIEAEVRSKIAPQIPRVAKAWTELESTIYEIRVNLSAKQAKAAGLTVSSDEKLAFTPDGQRIPLTTKRPKPKNRRVRMADVATIQANEFADEAAVQAQTKSPSRRTRKVAKDTVDGYVLELQNGEQRVAEVAAEQQKKRGRLATIGDRVSGFFSRRKEQAALDKQMAADRTAVAKELLLATDSEYAALENQRGILNRKVRLTSAQEAQLLKIIALQQAQEAELAVEIKNNGSESEVLKKRLALAAERGVVLEAESLNNLKQQKLTRMERFGNFANGAMGKMAGIGMTASMVAGAMTMLPGQIGQVAQSITPLIGGFSMLTMFIQGPWSAAIVGLVAAIGAVAYGFMQYNASIDKGIDKALAFGDALGSGTKAMQGFAEFAGTVTASEVLDRRRAQSVNPYQVVSGKTTFGESYVQSEGGKAMAKAISDQAKISGKVGAGANMKNQLVSAVLSGALGAAQARSIAVNLGRELGDEELGIRVSGEIAELVGPNGENVLKDGLAIRVKMMQETRGQIAGSSSNLNKLGGFTGKEALQTGGGIAAGAGAGAGVGAGIGAVVGNAIPIPGVGAAIGAGVGAVIGTVAGAIAGGFIGAQEHAERLGHLAGATVAIQANAMEQQKQMLDSLELDYEKRINAAKAAGDTAKADELQNKLIAERQDLLRENAATQQTITDSFKNSQYQNEMMSGVDKAIEKKYKDTPMEDLALAARDALGSVQNREQQYTLKMLLDTTVDPLQMLAITDLMGTDQAAISKVLNINTNLGGSNLNQIMAISGLFVDQNGKPATQIQKDFVIRMSSVTDGEQANKLMTLYSELGKSGMGWVNASVLVDFVSKNPALEATLMEDIQQIKDLKGNKLSVDIVSNAKILNEDQMNILRDDMEYFNSIDTKEGQQLYLQTVATYSGVAKIDDPGFNSWLAAEGKGYKADSYGWIKYVEWLAQRATTTRIGANAFAKDTGGTTTSGGPSASWLDDIVKKTRDVQSAFTKLTTGYKNSSKALVDFFKTGKNGLTGLSGLSDKLYSSNLDQSVIEGILGMNEEDWKKYGKMFVDAKGNITDLTKAISQIANQQKIEEFISSGQRATTTVNDRVAAMKALSTVTSDQAFIEEMASDNAIASMIANGMLNKTYAQQQDMLKKITKAKLADAAATRLSKGDVQNKIDDAQSKISVLEAQNNVYQNGLDIINNKAEKINESYDKQIKALEDVKSVNEEISRQKQGQLDLADALSRGDIGAAAKAMEQIRAQKAQDASDRQIKALQDAKQRAVDSLTVEINGQKMTRLDLEEKMRNINLEILEIKHDEIVQNELILAKQRDIYNTLIAQTAEQMRKNAEAAKPVNQKINIEKIIKTTNIGGGNGGGPGSTGDTGKTTADPTKLVSTNAVTTEALSSGVVDIVRGQNSGKSVYTGASTNDEVANIYKGLLTKFEDKQKTSFSNGYNFYTNSSSIKDLGKLNTFNAEKTAFMKTKEYLDAFNSGALDYRGIWKSSPEQFDYNDIGSGSLAKVQKYGYDQLPPAIKTRIDWLIDAAKTFDSDKTEYNRLRDLVHEAKKAAGVSDDISVNTLYAEYSKASQKDKPNTSFGKMLASGKVTTADVQSFLDQWNKIKNKAGLAFGYKKELASFGYNTDQQGELANFLASKKIEIPANIASQNREYIGYHKGVFNPDWVGHYATGGMVKPKYFSIGNFARGTDTIPAMLTPGEFVVSQPAVKNFGADNLKSINNGTYSGDSVYNYSVNVNVANTGANANDIARTVMAQIKQIDAQRIRSNVL